ncbi:MAG: hypothetical protein ABIM99_01795 [Candidatus Dojkabacteria bacterium]
MNLFKISKPDKIFVGTLTIISVIATILVYALQFNAPPIRSDGIGYYSYLPSIFIHKDISMKSLMDERAQKYNAPTPDSWNGINRIKNGNYLDKYTMGEAVLMLPFFIAAHVLSIVFHQTPNGFTLFYQLLIGFAGLFYMILGLYVVKKILEKYFSNKVIYISLTILTFGTNLFHYGTYDSIFSHTYSFFLFAAFLYFLPIWFENISNKRNAVILGTLVGLIALVRPTNIILPLIFILLWNLNLKKSTERILLFWSHKLSIIISIFVSILVFLPQLIYWRIITGEFFSFSYKGEYFDFAHPQIGNVLFSIQRGLLFWSPLIVIGIIGLFLQRKKLKPWLLPTAAFFVLNLFIISSWWAWSYGGGFGHRAFIESYAVLSIPFTALMAKIISMRNKFLRISLFILISLLVFLSIYVMINYWNRNLKPDGTTLEQFLSIFPAK